MDPSLFLSSAALLAAFTALWKGGMWYGEYKEHKEVLEKERATSSAAAAGFITRQEMDLREINTRQMLQSIVESMAEIKHELKALRTESKS
jgi:hypothetical protein